MSGTSQVETRVYRSFSDDFVESSDQGYRLPDDYVWVDESRSARAKAMILRAVGFIAAECYCKAALGMRFENRQVLDSVATQGGFFLYANHTQLLGDTCMPLIAVHPNRAYVLVSTSNLGIPVLGPLLPSLGALPVPDNLEQTKKLKAAVEKRLEQGYVVAVYPEAHLWPWNTGIRALPASAFSFPASTLRPVYTLTTTYQKRRLRKKPRSVVYVDGPFQPDPNLPKRERKERLRDEVQSAMVARSKQSTVSYVRYIPDEGAPEMPGSGTSARGEGGAM